MTTYEQCMKVGHVKPSLALDRRLQERQSMWGSGGDDYMSNTRKKFNGCANKVEKGPTNQKRMKGLAIVN
jgi:hypothetical protein